jgi:hypothetical protein
MPHISPNNSLSGGCFPVLPQPAVIPPHLRKRHRRFAISRYATVVLPSLFAQPYFVSPSPSALSATLCLNPCPLRSGTNQSAIVLRRVSCCSTAGAHRRIAPRLPPSLRRSYALAYRSLRESQTTMQRHSYHRTYTDSILIRHRSLMPHLRFHLARHLRVGSAAYGSPSGLISQHRFGSTASTCHFPFFGE